MLVEFLGVPGSGKSTISHILADTLRARRIMVAEVTYDLDKRHRRFPRLLLKSLQLSRFSFNRPSEALWGCRCIASTKQKTLLDFAKALFNWLFIASVIDSQRESVIIVLDQGVAQALWSVGYAAQRETWTDLLSREPGSAATMPDMVVHVRASVQSVGDRLRARAQRVSRLDSHGGDYPSLVRARTNSDAIVRRLRAKGVQVIDIDNDYPEQLITDVRTIADELMAMLARNNKEPSHRARSTEDSQQHNGVLNDP
jgi:thymidylate kinase